MQNMAIPENGEPEKNDVNKMYANNERQTNQIVMMTFIIANLQIPQRHRVITALG